MYSLGILGSCLEKIFFSVINLIQASLLKSLMITSKRTLSCTGAISSEAPALDEGATYLLVPLCSSFIAKKLDGNGQEMNVATYHGACCLFTHFFSHSNNVFPRMATITAVS
jgi:hypothetical protein